MHEVLTDELMDAIYERYRFYSRLCKETEQEPMTFADYVESIMEQRKERMERLRKIEFFKIR